MLKIAATISATLVVGALAHAGPTDQAIVAAMKIVEARNYTWTVSVPSSGRALPVREGKSEKGGFTTVTFIDPQSSMLRLISRMNDGEVKAVFHGPENFVFQTTDGWKDGHELVNFSARRRMGPREPDYWISLQSPGEELEIIVGSYTELHELKGAVAGTLSEDGARQLLGSVKAPAVSATGTFILALSGDVLAAFVVDITGTVMTGPPGQETESPPQHRLLITEFKDVGKTKVEVPDEVRLKLSP